MSRTIETPTPVLTTHGGERVLKPTVNIVGFAPSWVDTPWDDQFAENWGMNALFKIAGDRRWDRWYQLHDLDQHHATDKPEHVEWMAQTRVPVYVWPEHQADLLNAGVVAIPYPKQAIINHFGKYFTNTVSWMIAHAIYEGRRRIGVYGVDMAQDSEYAHQRPSCEYFLGWAKGAGIDIVIPPTSDLLKSSFLYGAEDGNPLRIKMEGRLSELSGRREGLVNEINKLQGQLNQHNQVLQQILGAEEDTRYWLRAWTQPVNDGSIAS